MADHVRKSRERSIKKQSACVPREKAQVYMDLAVVGGFDDERDKEEREMKPVMGEALCLSFLLLSEREATRAAGL